MPTSRRTVALLLSLILVACGDTAPLTAPSPASQSNPHNPYAVAARAPAAPRYRLANTCVTLHDDDGGHLAAFPDGSLAMVNGASPEPTPFFLRPTTLGQYLFFGPDERFLTLAARADELAAGLEGVVAQLGYTVSGVGDLLEGGVRPAGTVEADYTVGRGALDDKGAMTAILKAAGAVRLPLRVCSR